MANRKAQLISDEDMLNREEMFKMAVHAARNGQQQGAVLMFRQLLTADARNVRAMLWLAKLSTKPSQRRLWLKHALRVEPDNTTARRALKQLNNERAIQRNRNYMRLFIGVYILAVLGIALLVLSANNII